MVFHTAPPQPASKARLTWSPQLVGGPEASQNGLGDRTRPAKRTLRSATGERSGDAATRGDAGTRRHGDAATWKRRDEQMGRKTLHVRPFSPATALCQWLRVYPPPP